jgi:hypothetical protein
MFVNFVDANESLGENESFGEIESCGENESFGENEIWDEKKMFGLVFYLTASINSLYMKIGNSHMFRFDM